MLLGSTERGFHWAGGAEAGLAGLAGSAQLNGSRLAESAAVIAHFTARPGEII